MLLFFFSLKLFIEHAGPDFSYIVSNYDEILSKCDLWILFLLLSCVGVNKLGVGQCKEKKTALFFIQIEILKSKGHVFSRSITTTCLQIRLVKKNFLKLLSFSSSYRGAYSASELSDGWNIKVAMWMQCLVLLKKKKTHLYFYQGTLSMSCCSKLLHPLCCSLIFSSFILSERLKTASIR